MKQRIIATILSVVMMLTMLPMTVFASLLDNSTAYNQTILSELTELCGGENEAKQYYAILEQYGLLDEDGNATDSWSITLDGKAVTLEEIRSLLAEKDCDLQKNVVVDGKPIKLGDLKTMLEIEDYIAHLRDTYYSGGQWTQEQQTSLKSLMAQVNGEGIQMKSTAGAASPSGINHQCRISVTCADDGYQNGVLTLENGQEHSVKLSFSLNMAQPTQNVSFSVAARSASAQAGILSQETVTFAPGETVKEVTLTIPAQNTTGWNRWNGNRVFYVTCYAPLNALFAGNQLAWSLPVTLTAQSAFASKNEVITFDLPAQSAGLDPMFDAATVDIMDHETPEILFNIKDNIYNNLHFSFANAYPSIYFGTEKENRKTAFVSQTSGGDYTGNVATNRLGDSVSGYGAYEGDISFMVGPTFFYTSGTLTLTYQDTTKPTVTAVTAPAATYTPGQIVPVKVQFSEPVCSDGIQVQINGRTLTPAEGDGTISQTLTFPYTVQALDARALLLTQVTGAADPRKNEMNTDSTAKNIVGVNLETPNQADAIIGLTAEITAAQTAPKLTATVSLSDNDKLTAWLNLKAEGTKFVTTNLFASIDGKIKVPLTAKTESFADGLTADFDLPLNNEDSTQTHTVELWLGIGENLLFGKAASADLTAAKFVTASDLTAKVSVKTADGKEFDIKNTIFLQEKPQISVSYMLSGTGFSFATANDFLWSSSDPAVANIDKLGKITPTGKEGTVKFNLTALNGNVTGKAVTVSTETLTFGLGLTPFLLIPNKELTSLGGQDVTVYWSSNLCNKNEDETAFSVNVKRGEKEVYSIAVTGSKKNPAAAVTIPANILEYDYTQGASNIFTVTVTATYADQEYRDSATISLESKPALVKFDKLPSYYITDQTQAVDIGWVISNFDRYSGSADFFKLEVTKNGTALAVPATPGTGVGGTYSGSYSLTDLAVTANPNDPTSYRDVYTITIQAKNGSASTWSYDSFLLYVYDADALRILVDGATQDGLTMSNKSKITKMGQTDILALNRDISLKNAISLNYRTYAWSEIADQIAWASGKNEVATVNYQQGTLYEDIRDFAYVSYRPTTDFLLSGLTDGESIVTATHKLTGMADSVKITVETLKDKLYLFQCYPQTTTTLTYTDGAGKSKTATSDEHGAAAIYEETGIADDVYCSATVGDITYLGTFYQAELKTGEGDAVRLERYPCNNLQLRRAAYAYLYLKQPDGTPYTGSVTFRGGVYVNDVYKKDALFVLNDSSEKQRGDTDTAVTLGTDGKLAVTMDQTQWELTGNALTAGDKVSYVFQIALDNDETTYYPLFTTINATSNEDAFVGSGEAVVNFRKNSIVGKQPFIIQQISSYANYGVPTPLLDYTGNVGPSGTCPEATLTTAVMWWGDAENKNPQNDLRLLTETGLPVGDGAGEATLHNTAYPFLEDLVTEYSVKLNEETMKDTLTYRKTTGLYLDYLRDGKTLTRHESLPFRLCNMIDSGKIEDQAELGELLGNLGEAAGTSAGNNMDFGDAFVNIALNLAAGDSYTTGDKKLFQIQLAPTADPSKFLGFIQMNVGNMENNVTGIYADSESRKSDFGYVPGPTGLMVLAGIKKPMAFAMDQMSDYNKVLKRKAVSNVNFKLDGYAESLIYFNDDSGKWEIQILNGGFKAGGGMNYTWNWNFWCGPVPCTTSLAIGGSAVVGMDALTVAYYNATQKTTGIGNDFLTELRIYLYLRFFAGVGIDYSIIAFKLGIYGQINLDMRFQWLNRPYMDSPGDEIINRADGLSNVGNAYNLNGQKFKIDGQIGMQFLMKFLFFSYEKILYSYNFNLLDQETNDWITIQYSWEKNKAANKKAIEELLKNGSLSAYGTGNQQMLALNLAPTVESRDYLDEGGRAWGAGISPFSLDRESSLENLQSNTYPYANPVLSDDGALVAYLSDGDSKDSTKTRAAYGVQKDGSYGNSGNIDTAVGYGDSQLVLSGNARFAATAWTRQSVNLDKDSGAVVTDADQMMMMNGTEVYASVYNGKTWETTALTANSAPDLAPVVATNGKSGTDARAIVAWRSVAASGKPTGEDARQVAGVTTFDQKDSIVYKLYDGSAEGSKWGNIQTLYNGTSGAVKGIVAAMLADGTPAIAYTIDTDQKESTTNDREIVYATLSKDSREVTRNVQATNDGYLDENPQLTAVTFPNKNGERFVLGWYSEQAVTSDAAAVLNGEPTDKATTADIRLRDFTAEGVTEQLLPDSISQVADSYGVAITSNFRFTKNATSINDLSILWAERAAGELVAVPENPSAGKAAAPELTAERDVLKGIKFYTDPHETVRFTGAVDVAEMPQATLIDHFDAYVSNPQTNEIKAAILGTTYGANGTFTKVGETVNGDKVQYTVPSATSIMYTATETYMDKIEVPAVLPHYETVKKGAETQLQFTIDNKGIHAITELAITVGDTTTVHSKLNLLPGGSILLAADYLVPSDGVIDPEYTVKATFSDTIGAKGAAEDLPQATGKVYLNLPDVAIIDAKILSEEGGNRTIQLKLNNHSDADLKYGTNSVKISFFKDVTCAEPFAELSPITISSAADLAMMNDGGYSKQITFDVGKYVKGTETAAQEIPESGVAIYCRAEVLDNQSAPQGEPVTKDNFASVTCENLQLRNQQAVTLTSDLAVQNGKTTVTVTLQNNRLSETQTGNLIVSLLDANGKVLEQQQSYKGQNARANNNGLITLTAEQKHSERFSFNQPGVSVQTTYSDVILTDDNANLSSITFTNIPGITLASFTESKETHGTYTAQVSTHDLAATTVIAVTESGRSKAKVVGTAGTESNAISQEVSLTQGANTAITITVTAQNNTVKTFILTVENKQTTHGGGGGSIAPLGCDGGIKCPSHKFTDVDHALWYHVAVDYAVAHGLFSGTAETLFSPDTPMTRGMLVTVLYRAAGQPSVEGEILGHPFADVDANDYYGTAVYWARMHDIVGGYEGGNYFGPNDPVTREQMATILYRYAQCEGRSATAKADLTRFTDSASISDYAKSALSWACANGLLQGSGGALLPKDSATRAQVAAVLMRYSQNQK